MAPAVVGSRPPLVPPVMDLFRSSAVAAAEAVEAFAPAREATCVQAPDVGLLKYMCAGAHREWG